MIVSPVGKKTRCKKLVSVLLQETTELYIVNQNLNLLQRPLSLCRKLRQMTVPVHCGKYATSGNGYTMPWSTAISAMTRENKHCSAGKNKICHAGTTISIGWRLRQIVCTDNVLLNKTRLLPTIEFSCRIAINFNDQVDCLPQHEMWQLTTWRLEHWRLNWSRKQ